MSVWEEKNLYDRIAERLEQRESDYSSLKGDRELIAEYFRLDLPIQLKDKTQSLILGREIYEGTAPWAARIMATGFQGRLISKSIDWLMYKMVNLELQGIDELDIWCQDIKDQMTESYQTGNFYDVQPDFTLTGLTIGSPLMFVEENINTGKTMWMPQFYKYCYLFYNSYNELEGVIVKDPKWTAKQIYETFCKAVGPEAKKAERLKKLTIDLNDELQNGLYYKNHTVIRAVFRADDPLWDVKDFKKPIGNRKWFGAYFQEGCKQERKNIPLQTDGHRNRPFVVWDYNKKPWDVASSTPAFEAYHDTLSHQEVHKEFLENVKHKNRPPRVFLNTMKNRLELSPEGLMPVTEEEYSMPPKAVDTIGDVTFNKELSDIFAEAIKRHFHLDQLLTFMRRLEQKQSPLTATETIKLDAESAAFLSPFIESHSRYLVDCDECAMGIEIEAGRGAFEPDRLAEIADIVYSKLGSLDNVKVRPELIGPLHRAQKMSQTIEPIRAGVALVGEIASNLGDPNLPKMLIKPYETADDALTAVNFPQKNIRTKEEFDELADALAAQQQQEKAAQYALEAAKAVPSLSKSVEEGSPISALTGAGVEK